MGKCGDKDGPDCEDNATKLVASMETINDDVNNIGIEFVMTKEKKMARQLCAVTSFPALALFRNGGHCTLFAGSLDSEVEILNWISDIETIEVEGLIEEVNIDLLQNLIESEDEVNSLENELKCSSIDGFRLGTYFSSRAGGRCLVSSVLALYLTVPV